MAQIMEQASSKKYRRKEVGPFDEMKNPTMRMGFAE
jgi:hypothetical protein